MKQKNVERCVKAIAKGMAEVIVERAMSRFMKLTEDEVGKFSGPDCNDEAPYYLARVLCLSVVGDNTLTGQFSAYSIQKDRLPQKLTRIIEKRP